MDVKIDRNLKQTTERGIAICRYPKDKRDLYNQWWRYCKSLGLPFVVVIPEGKYATVVIDSFSTGWGNQEGLSLNDEEMRKVDEEYSNEIESFIEDFVEEGLRRIKKDSLFGGGVHSSIVVKSEYALEIADKFRSIWFASYGKVKGFASHKI